MGKQALIDDVQARCVEAGVEITKKDVKVVIESTFAAIIDWVADGAALRIGHFGTFDRAYRKARTGKNPSTGEPLRIPAMYVAKFKPSKAFKEKLNEV